MTDDQDEAAQLRTLPRAIINALPLRRLTSLELRDILNSPAIVEKWERIWPALDHIVRIEDMKTPAVNPGDRRALFYLITAFRTRRVLEIGTGVGASTAHIAVAMKELDAEGSHLEPLSFVTVDIQDANDFDSSYWKVLGLDHSPQATLEALGTASFTMFLTSDSVQYLTAATYAEKFDLIFLDGDHAAAKAYEEVPLALNHLCEGGVIILHDYFPNNRPLWSNNSVVPGPFLAIDRLCREGSNMKVEPLGELPWPTKLGSHVTSLAVLTREF
jgi:predicted O-methyltransferase YrrM